MRGFREPIRPRCKLFVVAQPWDRSFLAGMFTGLGEDRERAFVPHFDAVGIRSRFPEDLSEESRAVARSGNGGIPGDLFDRYEGGEPRTISTT